MSREVSVGPVALFGLVGLTFDVYQYGNILQPPLYLYSDIHTGMRTLHMVQRLTIHIAQRLTIHAARSLTIHIAQRLTIHVAHSLTIHIAHAMEGQIHIILSSIKAPQGIDELSGRIAQ